MAKKKKAATKVAAKSKGAARKPAAKKPAAKKQTAKKPVAKKPAVKKPVAKKPAAKTAAKKPAAKPAAKKPAVKTTVKKPAAKKPAAKPAPKPEAIKPVVKKPAPPKKPQNDEPDAKYRNLFDAFQLGKLPFAHGYIVSSFFSETTAYSIYEIVSYAGVKEIFPSDTGLQFITGGKKLFILVEHDTYDKKFIDPVSRAQGESIPKRFNELDLIIAKNQTKIYIAKEADETYGSFTILKPQGQNFAVVFYDLPDMYETLTAFFLNSLNRQRRVPQGDAKKAAAQISETVKKYMSFAGEFE